MLSCKDVTEILNSEKKQYFTERDNPKIHLLICKYCSNYEKHSKLLKIEIKRNLITKSSKIKNKYLDLENKIIKKL